MTNTTYSVYSDHCGHVVLPVVNDLGDVRLLAEAASRMGVDALYRVFERTPMSPTGEQFVVAYSVLAAVVTLHESPTIPKAHW